MRASQRFDAWLIRRTGLSPTALRVVLVGASGGVHAAVLLGWRAVPVGLVVGAAVGAWAAAAAGDPVADERRPATGVVDALVMLAPVVAFLAFVLLG